MNRLHIGAINTQVSNSLTRISAEIAGCDLWYESADLALAPSVEAFASSLLIPCLLKKVELEIDGPICSTWISNSQKIVQLLDDNWGLEPVLPQFREEISIGRNTSTNRAQFFSGGVDSFHTLLTASSYPDYLVFVHGWDIGLDDPERFENTRKSVESVANALGIKSCVVRTNMRDNPVLRNVAWDDAYGGALASVGHLLSPHIGSITIPPSWHTDHQEIGGSDWRLDPLWSSANLEIIHGNNSLFRAERLLAIIDEPLVQKNLRVCWANVENLVNCSRCEKCLRTMVVLHHAGKLDKFSVFDSTTPIWELIDAMPYVTYTVNYEDAINRGVEPRLESAIRRLLRRSRLASNASSAMRKSRAWRLISGLKKLAP